MSCLGINLTRRAKKCDDGDNQGQGIDSDRQENSRFGVRKGAGGSNHRHGFESDPEVVSRLKPSSIGERDHESGCSSHPGYSRPTGEHPADLVERKSHELRAFTVSELRSATKNFSPNNKIGEGGFGSVYKGVIKHKSKFQDVEVKIEVAIKKLNTYGLQGHHEWITEVHFLGIVDNPYVVKLIGYCADDEGRRLQRLLVYEYMPNKGLDDHLFRTSPTVLSWQTRVKIALGAAKGLAYLHEDKEVIFRDFKAANVLLDDEFNPKLSDFGLARQGPEANKSHVTTAVKGTYGYAAPEYMHTGHLTFKSDVFSFGMVLLEILTGRKAMENNAPKKEQRLLEWVKPFIRDTRKFHLAMDTRLEQRYPPKGAMKFASTAIQCLMKQPKERPKMTDVVEGLKKVMEMTYAWETPALSVPTTPHSHHAAATTTDDVGNPLSPYRSAESSINTDVAPPQPKSPRPSTTRSRSPLPSPRHRAAFATPLPPPPPPPPPPSATATATTKHSHEGSKSPHYLPKVQRTLIARDSDPSAAAMETRQARQISTTANAPTSDVESSSNVRSGRTVGHNPRLNFGNPNEVRIPV
ncbi:serine/threonine-protein kinase PCRK1 [Physcomitrium patens]|uniref:non-specific serine/threonine protein kinase n=1 Tax=Physcomitrium patens TaxID=3218 RepID=A0A2K1J3X1_PHYPA|nr:serine/threonine-protein kinase PCRK1-like [Physcomitrium patens]XP_024399834.1 serine/threonine-protein kinase PCRK1-like [Physcomitrium patens]XP_024399835.1 serine/threonine-protein kinase PCRK1-like [Physcomitrium patens]XP_024399836.1 serine/threonine-protein kinase PCRK1-like [Physcomitrium patens]XP_024399837.1 serine/threonine-protein kinase PCRK1-like [Physcomitrium patens]PNR36229.1 hypothetical protein PHYPA_022080 [Physcomitrium patens]|eukprot:XP_024399832.1 serine/threonine-protein kinase PCRK1-like [Physcomitrella patens]